MNPARGSVSIQCSDRVWFREEETFWTRLRSRTHGLLQDPTRVRLHIPLHTLPCRTLIQLVTAQCEKGYHSSSPVTVSKGSCPVFWEFSVETTLAPIRTCQHRSALSDFLLLLSLRKNWIWLGRKCRAKSYLLVAIETCNLLGNLRKKTPTKVSYHQLWISPGNRQTAVALHCVLWTANSQNWSL